MGEEDTNASKAQELKDLGNRYFAEGKLGEAVKAYTDGLKLEQDNHLLYSNRAAAYLKLNNLENALADAKKCVDLAPEWAKGYTRLAQALYRAGDLDECNKIVDKLEELEKDNHSIPTLRKAVKTKKVFKQLEGKWYGRVSEELGGYLQEFDFKSETVVYVSVFGRNLVAKLKLDVSQEPGYLDLLVQQEPGQPQAPEVKHIFKIEDGVLHLCSPYLTPPEQRPTSFGGPAYVKMFREPLPEDGQAQQVREKVNKMTMNERYINFAKDIAAIVPKYKLPDNIESLPETSPEAQAAVLLSVKFQNEYFSIKNVYGDTVEEKVQKFLIRETRCPTKEVEKAIDNLRKVMQETGMFPRDEDIAQQQGQQTDFSNIESLNVDSSNLAPKSVSAATSTSSSTSTTASSSTPTPGAETPQSSSKKDADVAADDKTTTLLAIGAVALAAGALAFIFMRNRSNNN